MANNPEDEHEGGFLQRWSKRKAAVKNENLTILEDESLDEERRDEDKFGDAASTDTLEAAEGEDKLSDEDLCAKYELTHPDQCHEPEELDDFFNRSVPDRLKQLAMRRLWRLNPLFRFADEMVEYGENYTDAATVLPDMQTAYKVGKGYFDKLMAEKADAEKLDDDGDDHEEALDETSKQAHQDETAHTEDDAASHEDASNEDDGNEGEIAAESNEERQENPRESVKSQAEIVETPSLDDAEARLDDAPMATPSPPPIRPRQVSFTRK